MALNYQILSKKNEVLFNSDFDESSSVRAYDLLSNTVNNSINVFLNTLVVPKDYICRPDLISLAYYGTDKYADVICKINGISNPFELNAGDIIGLPNVDAIDYYLNGSNSEVDDTFIESTDESIKKRSTVYQKLKNDETRLPGEQLIGDVNYVIDKSNNIVYY